MDEGTYTRLSSDCCGGRLVQLLPKQSGRGGARPGAGRPKGSISKAKPAQACKQCSDQLVAPGHTYCEPCARQRKAAQMRAAQKPRSCEHQKPTFANGKQRKLCYQCAPKPPPKPRKEYTPKVQRHAVCASEPCGAAFVQTVPSQKFCSSKCKNKVTNRAKQELLRNNAARPCRHCGKVYTPEYGSLRTHYCTLDCRRKSINLRTGGNTHRRRAKKFGCEYTPINRRDVFERDGWRCYLCGCDTPAELSGARAQNSPELDHVVPLSKGGAHSYENTRCSCRSCNLLKSDKLVGTSRG